MCMTLQALFFRDANVTQLFRNLMVKILNNSNMQILSLSGNMLEAQDNKLSPNTLKTSATVELTRPRSVVGVHFLASSFWPRISN